MLDEIKNLKKDFYTQLKKFMNKGFVAEGKINNASLQELKKYENLDWSLRDNLEKVKEYIHSLRG